MSLLHRRLGSLAIGALLGLALLEAASAQSIFEKLVNPGPLIEGHSKLEKDCAQCHEPFSQKTQSSLCLGCHKPIAADIAQHQGFHGRHPTISHSECRSCHTDHKGRQAEIVGLDPETFRHDLTDFALKGAHANARCDGCHKPGKRMRDAPLDCVGCHKADEPHEGRLGSECATCHSVETWRTTKAFDHGKTKFPLTGAHRDVACTTCHAGEQWKGIGNACVDCHRLGDPHGGRYGAKCETCHTTEKWASVHFDHDKATKFPLRGEHRKLQCTACHKGDLYREKLQTNCNSCHKEHDPHRGQLGTRCERCHNEAGWRQKVAFDHDLARFPLIGLHAAVPCEGCHVSQSFKETPSTCVACHKDTHHEGRLGTSCHECHNPNGWALWHFDHSTETRFPLTGAHAGLSCAACHREKNPTTLILSSECYSCHSQDDKHRGAFGRACGTCHSTTAFSVQLKR